MKQTLKATAAIIGIAAAALLLIETVIEFLWIAHRAGIPM